jgi:hypothetical protein
VGKFVSKIRFDVPFEDEKASFVLRPMDHAVAVRLSSLPAVPVVGDDGQPKLDNKTGKPVMSRGEAGMALMREAFIEHLEEISGLTDAAGNRVPPEQIVKAAYYGGLVVSAIDEWGSRSIPGYGGGDDAPKA